MISNPVPPWVIVSIVSVFGLLLFAGCRTEQHAAHPAIADLPPVKVTVAAAEERTPLRQIEVMATVEAEQSASVAARVSGNITELPVRLGDRVKAGDMLVVISAGEIRAQVNQALAQLEQAERNLKREQSLLEKNAATQESVKTLEESRKIAEAAYREARTMLDYTTITAPFDGVITSKPANVGDLAVPGKILLTIENGSSLQIIADVPEALVLGLSIGDRLPVRINAAGLDIQGTITEIAPTADPRSRTAPIKLDIEPSPKLRSGQFARVSLPSTSGSAVMVPAASIRPFGQLDRVFIVKDGTVRLQLVKTGLKHGESIEILSGVNGGDSVVISDTRELSDGRKVTVN
ncbi:MAG: efflux RND transporter periplasmic adaptor subunit [Desulfofustis sp.]|nr:efflux RND transporter periplasmic adaptor subunit [Desulfofustis sp.]